jgi:GcrA cell cycle regulator
VIRLLAAGAVTAAQVEKAAAIPAPAQTNGGTAKGEPPAPPVEPPPAPALADPGSTTVAALLALCEASCRWPIGDPRDRNFRFCSAAATVGPYCARHHTAACLAQPLPKARPGFRPSTTLAGSLTPVGAHECPSRSLRVYRS